MTVSQSVAAKKKRELYLSTLWKDTRKKREVKEVPVIKAKQLLRMKVITQNFQLQ